MKRVVKEIVATDQLLDKILMRLVCSKNNCLLHTLSTCYAARGFSRLTLHRYGDCLAILSRDGGRSHGYQGLSRWDGGHNAGLLLRLGDANGSSWCCGLGAAS